MVKKGPAITQSNGRHTKSHFCYWELTLTKGVLRALFLYTLVPSGQWEGSTHFLKEEYRKKNVISHCIFFKENLKLLLQERRGDRGLRKEEIKFNIFKIYTWHWYESLYMHKSLPFCVINRTPMQKQRVATICDLNIYLYDRAWSWSTNINLLSLINYLS